MSSGSEPCRRISLMTQMATLLRLTSYPGTWGGRLSIPIRLLVTSNWPFCNAAMLFFNGMMASSDFF